MADPSRDELIRTAADNLRVDAATAEVVRAFKRMGVTAILLKGPTFGRWLYRPDERRGYSDCDLLVAPDRIEAAESVLGELGFARRYDISGLPDWWLEHAHEWWRDADGVWVDLHDTLPGLGVDEQQAWRALSSDATTIDVAGEPVPALALSARALHVVLHAAHHGEAWGKVLDDLERAVARGDRDTWRAAAALAERLEATDAFGAGLRLLPAGAALAEELGLPENRSVEIALRAGRPAPMALGFEQLAGARGWSARLRVVARKVVPPPGFMRHWYPRAADSRAQLAFAYVYRPVWLLLHAAAGFRAWRSARRDVAR